MICNERLPLTLIGKAAMIPASELVPRVADITGLPHSTIYSVKRRFVETGIWPSARGAHVPDLDTRHVAMLLLALLADVPAKDAVRTASLYHDLSDEQGNKFGDVLVNMIDSYRLVNLVGPLVYKSTVELDCNSPRACVTSECNDGSSIVTLYGSQLKQWSDIRVRRSMTISGKVLFDLAMGLHFNRWAKEAA
jgi:hypothetical protein